MSSEILKTVKIDELKNEPYIKVLCYPEPNLKIAYERIVEVKELQVIGILFEGKVKIGELEVAGKGCVSIVVKALTESGFSALKIRRMDANRDSMFNEAKMHLMANSIGVGPELFGVTSNFILMEYIDGYRIIDWLKGIKEYDIKKIQNVIRKVLDQCYALDKLGLDHGELSNPKKHIIVSGKPVILDFESASIKRRVANVIKVTQYLFLGGPMAQSLRERIDIRDSKSIIDSLRNYKEKGNELSYMELLPKLRLV